MLHPGSGDFFQVMIEAMADPSPPNLDNAASAEELRNRLDQLLMDLRDISAREAMDQVYRRLVIQLCNGCYRSWIENPAGGPS